MIDKHIMREAEKTMGYLNPDEMTMLAQYAEAASVGIVEIGAFRGRSTIVIAGHCSVPFWSIDPHDDYWCTTQRYGPQDNNEFMANISRAGVGNMVNILNAPSHDIWIMFRDIKYDLVFVDGKHDYESARRDFGLWQMRLEKGGTMLMHDVHLESVRKVIDESGWNTVQRVGSLEALRLS